MATLTISTKTIDFTTTATTVKLRARPSRNFVSASGTPYTTESIIELPCTKSTRVGPSSEVVPTLVIPNLTITSTRDALVGSSAHWIFEFIDETGAVICLFEGFEKVKLPALFDTGTTASWAQVRQFNAAPAPLIQDRSTYSREQIDAKVAGGVGGASTWAALDKTVSSIADITTRDHSLLNGIGSNTHAQLDTAVAASAAHIANVSNPHGVTKSQVGLGNVDNTSDANKPVSTAQQAALDLKAPIASPTFTGTVSGITKAMVGLGNVDNTSDANKPVSTAQQTALNLKADLAGATFTGAVAGVSFSGSAHASFGGYGIDPTYAANNTRTTIAAKEMITLPQGQQTGGGGFAGKHFGVYAHLLLDPTADYIGVSPDTIANWNHIETITGNTKKFYNLIAGHDYVGHAGTGQVDSFLMGRQVQVQNLSTATIASNGIRIMNLISSNAGTTPLHIGLNINPSNAGTSTDYRGLNVIVQNTGSVDTQSVIRVRNSSGTYTTRNTGIEIDDQTSGVTSPLTYNFWSKGSTANNLIEGDLQLNKLTANSLVYVDANKKTTSVTIGSNLSFAGGTLSATGGGSGDMVLAGVQTVTGAKSFDATKLIIGTAGSAPSVVARSLYYDTGSSKLFFGKHDGSAWAEVFLAGLSGPMSVANGGTGAATLTGILKGNGTSAFTAATAGTDYVVPTLSFNNQTGTTYTLVAADNGKVITLNNASAITVTLPSGLGVGFNCILIQKGAGQVSFTTSSSTLRHRQTHTKIAGQYGEVSLIQHVTDEFVLAGDTAA